MQYVGYSIAVWSILLVCGLPLAFILLPRALKRLALPAAPAFGYSYIVFVGYYLYRTNIGGTDVYAPFMLIPPLAALLILIGRRRLLLAGLFNRRSVPMLGFAALSFLAVSLLYCKSEGRAVALSLSNLDVADYASDARYLQEFARNTQVGFMGQSGFFMYYGDNFWFGPSMLAALMSTLTFSEPFRLQSLAMGLVACQGAAFVYAIARDSLSLKPSAAFAVALVYALNPVIAFTVWQSFGGQMISIALALAVIYLVTRAQAGPPQPRLLARYVPAMVFLLSGMYVTYHFMVGLIAVLLGAYVLIFALAERSPRRLLAGGLVVGAALVLTVALNPLRLPGAIETLSAVKDSSNGWFIPWLGPDVQLGFNAALKLAGSGFRIEEAWGWTLAGALTVLLAAHLLLSRGRPAHVAFVLGLAVPVFALGLFYAVAEAQNGTLGGYRSFKVTATFVALTLLAYALWFGVRRARWDRAVAAAGGVLAAALVVLAAVDLGAILRAADGSIFVPPEELTNIRDVESMTFVSGINVMDDTPFELFWTHYFTLRKRQVFQTFPYSGREIGPLIQPYRLGPDPSAGTSTTGDIFAVETVGCNRLYRLTGRLSLCEPKSNYDVTMTPGEGWWPHQQGLRWSGREGRSADVFIDNRLEGTRVRIRASYGTLRAANSISLQVDGRAVPVEETPTELVSAAFALKAGRNVAHFTEALAPERPDPREDWTLGVMWRQILIEFPDLHAAHGAHGRAQPG